MSVTMPRFILLLVCVPILLGQRAEPPIDRRALVDRHQPVLKRFDPEAPLSVGNGELAFTVDATGLQTFPEAYEQTIPLGTLSQWGWHTAPNPHGWSIETFKFEEFESHGRKVGYADIPNNRRTPEIEWLRANPHRLHLGRIGFRLTRRDGQPATPADLSGIEQTLDLWNGEIRSRFQFEGELVEVDTICHPARDALGIRVRSALLGTPRLAIQIRFPYGTGQVITADWTRPDAHVTRLSSPSPNTAVFARRLDADSYEMRAQWSGGTKLSNVGPHAFELAAGAGAKALDLVAAFSSTAATQDLPSFEQTRTAARDHWSRFWTTGGAIDLSGSADPRWRELERRIVLSQYLTAIQCAGRYPPQETGLTFNSWEGKFHLEMHWWHAAQFALWDRLPLLDRSLDYYAAILPRARETAARQGYQGARWPKMTDPRGTESPSSVGPFLVWQQPHPIFYAELVYRERRDPRTLERFRDVVFESARFMASYATLDAASGRYVLGPPLQCAQEAFPKDRTFNCAFELAYWRWGLETAQAWRTRLGLAREPAWDTVLERLSPLPTAEGIYAFAEDAGPSTAIASGIGRGPAIPQLISRDHPSVVAALGVLPGHGVDRDTMRRTLDWIWGRWTWADTWGWDYPMLAMTAARLGDPHRAVDALLLDTPKNVYRANGHNHQRPGLTIYLPGNGALLYAVAMMAAGWDGGPETPAPGFPADGRWHVRWERLRRAP